MHNWLKYTADAHKGVIDDLKKRYTFVIISKLIMRDDYVIDHIGKRLRTKVMYLVWKTMNFVEIINIYENYTYHTLKKYLKYCCEKSPI